MVPFSQRRLSAAPYIAGVGWIAALRSQRRWVEITMGGRISDVEVGGWWIGHRLAGTLALPACVPPSVILERSEGSRVVGGAVRHVIP